MNLLRFALIYFLCFIWGLSDLRINQIMRGNNNYKTGVQVLHPMENINSFQAFWSNSVGKKQKKMKDEKRGWEKTYCFTTSTHLKTSESGSGFNNLIIVDSDWLCAFQMIYCNCYFYPSLIYNYKIFLGSVLQTLPIYSRSPVIHLNSYYV